MGVRGSGFIPQRIGKTPTVDDARGVGPYIPRFRNIGTDKRTDFIRGYHFQGGGGAAEYPSHAHGVQGVRRGVQELGAQILPGADRLRRLRRGAARRENRVLLDPRWSGCVGHPGAEVRLPVRRQREEDGGRHGRLDRGDVPRGRRRGHRDRARGRCRKAGRSTRSARRAWATIPKTSYADAWCRPHGIANVFLADASPYVSGGTQNTTWTILAMCWRTMDYVKEADAGGQRLVRLSKLQNFRISIADCRAAVEPCRRGGVSAEACAEVVKRWREEVPVKRIGMGLVGAGFIGPHHLEAVRRLGFVDVVAIADFNDELARQKAEALGVPKSYGSYQALLADPDMQVVHNATPNYMHHPVSMAAIAAGKHIVSDKPLAMTSAAGAGTARRRHGQGRRARGDVQLPRQPARAAGADDDRQGRDRAAALHSRPVPAGLAAVRHRLQLAPRARQGRRVLGDGRHRVALVRPGPARVGAAHHARAGRPHDRHSGAQEADAARASLSRRRVPTTRTSRWTSRSRTCARCWCASRTAPRARSRSGRCARGTRTTCGSRSTAARRRCAGTRSSRTSCGSGTVPQGNVILQKDPSLMDPDVAGLRQAAGRASGSVA